MLNEHASKGFCAKIFWAIPKIRLIFSLILQINPPQVNPPQVNLPQVNPPQVNSPQVNHPKCKPPKCNLPAGQSSCRSIFPQVNPPQIKLPKWNLPKFKTLKCNPPWAGGESRAGHERLTKIWILQIQIRLKVGWKTTAFRCQIDSIDRQLIKCTIKLTQIVFNTGSLVQLDGSAV